MKPGDLEFYQFIESVFTSVKYSYLTFWIIVINKYSLYLVKVQTRLNTINYALCFLKTYTVLGTSIVIRILLLILKRKQILFIKTNLSSQLLFTEHKVIHVLNINANSDTVNFNFTVTLCNALTTQTHGSTRHTF